MELYLTAYQLQPKINF